jgi:hypothetical protein
MLLIGDESIAFDSSLFVPSLKREGCFYENNVLTLVSM